MCKHCGAALIDARMRESGFCCSGCSYVYRLVHEHGLASYYQIKDSITVPADAAVFQSRDYGWLESEQRDAEAASASGKAPVRPPELTLDVQGISCAGCVWLIERLFQQQAGARDIFVNAQLGSMRLRWLPGEFSAADFARKLQAFGYLAGPNDPSRAEPESRGLVKRVGLCAAFAMNIMLFTLPTYFGMEKTFQYAGLFRLIALGFATLSFLVGGSYFLGRAWQAMRMRVMHIDMPIAVGIAGAYVGSLYGWLAGRDRFIYFDFVGTFVLLMLVGRWAQVAAVERNRRRLLGQQAKPGRIRVLTKDSDPLAPSVREVKPEELRIGDRLVASAGQTIPVEARLSGGDAVFSLASINGEAEPRTFRGGQRVPAGSVNVGRADVVLEAMQPWSESLLARLLETGERPGWRHVFIERVVRGYLMGIFILAVFAGAFWWIKTGDGPKTWAVVTAVLVVSCPCAIGLAFPLADEMATTALRRRGVFVREDDVWGKLAHVRKLVFDKTGTLTLETPVLQNPEALRALDGKSRSALLALVRDSEHPVSQCLCENLLALGPVEPMPGAVTETIGFGLDIGSWSLGRAGWRGAGDATGEAPAGTTDLVASNKVVARFQFVDSARPDAVTELRQLQREGYSVFILSGDGRAKVGKLAQELSIPPEHALGELSPEAKAQWLESRGAGDVLMLGDGANDSLAFDRALCRGTPVVHRGVLEKKADFYYLGRGIGGIRELFSVDQARRRTQRVILIFSILYNALAVGAAVAGYMNPLVAAVLMPANSLVTLALVSACMRRVVFGSRTRTG